MPGRGKVAQIGSHFGDNLLRRRFPHARNGVEVSDGSLKRGAVFLNLRIEAGDGFV